MLLQNNYFVFSLMLVSPIYTTDLDALDPEYSHEDSWVYRDGKRPDDAKGSCLEVRPTNRDIIKRFCAILPYFDKDHSNTEFLRKLRASISGMSESDLLDREAAFYAATVIPLVFLQNYRDGWCLLERFYRALRLYQISHPTEKRSSLKLLQNFKAVSQKIRNFAWELPGPATRTTTAQEFDDEEFHNKKDIIYVKELIKNLG